MLVKNMEDMNQVQYYLTTNGTENMSQVTEN